jgi:uncharacterized protein YegP (UPF0339 family)
MAYKFEIYKDKSEQYRFRFKAPNGEIMFQGQGHIQKKSAKNAVESIQKNAGTPPYYINDLRGTGAKDNSRKQTPDTRKAGVMIS